MVVTEGFKGGIARGFRPGDHPQHVRWRRCLCRWRLFAILVDDTLYLKTDEASTHAFESEGMGPFTYAPAGKQKVAMPYWEVPPRLLEEPEELVAWAREAHRIARAGKAKAPRRPR